MKIFVPRPALLALVTMVCFGALSAQAQVMESVSREQYASGKDTPQRKNQSLKRTLSNLEKRYRVYISFDLDAIKDVEVSPEMLPKEGDDIERSLHNLLTPFNLSYEKLGENYYLIYDKTKSPSDRRKTKQRADVNDEKARAAIDVRGKVTSHDTNEPLPGVNVLVKGTTHGTVTDADGGYAISTPDNNAVLVFSFVGYASQEVSVLGQTIINISLEPDVSQLNTVVVIGYGTVDKDDLTGSISQVKSEEIKAVPVYNVEQALQGRAAGVSVRQNSGAPGSRIEVRVRGANSMIGSNQPLYVVDGFPITGDINFLNPADVASIDVLKDASATAIYGARGANGVVIITTKKGTLGQKSRIEIETRYGIQKEVNRYEMLNARQYAEVANEWLKNSGQEPYFNLDDVTNPGTDWQDFIFQDAPLHQHTLTFSGSSEKTSYGISANYFSQDGIMKYTGAKKGTFRINMDHGFNDAISLAVNVNFARNEVKNIPSDNGAHGSTMLAGALAAPPTVGVYDENGDIVRIDQVYSFGSIGMINPATYFPPYKDRTLTNAVVGNAALSINIVDGLNFKSTIGLEYTTGFRDQFTPIIFSGDRGSAALSDQMSNSVLNENILTYSTSFNDKHDLNFVLGYTYQTFKTRGFGIGVSGFSNNTTEDYNLSAAETIGTPTSNFSEWKLASWLGRVNYTFNEKYLITASVRADGSSRFGAENKWGVFPSGAVAWRLSDEGFLKDVDAISMLKVRASYGITGNTGLAPYQTLNRLIPVRSIYQGNEEEVGFVPAAISNPSLKWESTKQVDVGLDLALWNDRVRFTFDYYKKNTSNLLASVPLPSSTGFKTSLQNVGEIENKGLEFSLGTDILTGQFKWDIYTQVTTNKNKVVKLAGGSDIFGGGVNIFREISLAREGEPFGMFFGKVEDGLTDQGYIKYVDFDGDGFITLADQRIIGNPYPDFIYSFNSNFSYNGFSLNLFFEGVQGNDILWATAASHLNSFQKGSNQFSDLYGNYWTADNPNPNARYPIVAANSEVSNSDRFVEDGSYLRLKSVRLAYDLPFRKLGFDKFDRAQIYVSGTNLFTITNYPGIDPDVNTAGTDSQDITRRLTTGVDESAYPLSKLYSVGLILGF